MNQKNTQGLSCRIIQSDDPDSIRWALKVLNLSARRLPELNGSDSEPANVDRMEMTVAKAGEGNMNLVLRVTMGEESLILKQSRPWVQKYPSIAAPEERILAETDFYRRVADGDSHVNHRVCEKVPRILASSPEHYLLAIEDLGAASDYSRLYQRGEVDRADAKVAFGEAIEWLTMLHRLPVFESEASSVGCDELRQLNHDHMFVIAMTDTPAIDLDSVCPGWTKASALIRQDRTLRRALVNLGQTYLDWQCPRNRDKCLLHGDYYPGSWLHTDAGFRVIDPEFCFAGPPEFDLGILSAHRLFCDAGLGRESVMRDCESYQLLADLSLDPLLVHRFAGAEMIRRLIGVAQLPLVADLAQRRRWLEIGHDLVIGGIPR